MAIEWIACGSRIKGGNCGWSEDLPQNDQGIEILIEEEFVPETGEVIEYRWFRY
jgi:hypothetical protein